MTVGILPGADRGAANEWVSRRDPDGLGEMRNALVVRAADAVIAVGGAYGTLSEIALALKTGVPVVGIETWPIDGSRAGAARRPRPSPRRSRCAVTPHLRRLIDWIRCRPSSPHT